MANIVERYQGREHFVDGYVLQSMSIEYFSLRKNVIWTDMGPMLASLAARDTFILGLTTTVFASETAAFHSNGLLAKNVANYTDYAGGWNFDGSVFMWTGLVVTLVMATAGVACTPIGCRDYKAYRKEFDARH